jgi:hypothetical protein
MINQNTETSANLNISRLENGKNTNKNQAVLNSESPGNNRF